MPKTIAIMTTAATLILAGATGTIAQGTTGRPVVVQPGPAYGGDSGAAVPALRQRQPRRGDVPVADQNAGGPYNIDAQDAELDRKIRSICRGC